VSAFKSYLEERLKELQEALVACDTAYETTKAERDRLAGELEEAEEALSNQQAFFRAEQEKFDVTKGAVDQTLTQLQAARAECAALREGLQYVLKQQHLGMAHTSAKIALEESPIGRAYTERVARLVEAARNSQEYLRVAYIPLNATLEAALKEWK